MKIQYVNSIPKNINILKSKKYNQKLSFTSDKFIRQTTQQPSKEDKDFFNFLDKKGKVDREEFTKILLQNPKLIQKAYHFVEFESLISNVNTEPSSIAKASYCMKNFFDEKFGKNNYRIISIGTSPAVLSQGMEALGNETIYLPATGIGNYVFRNRFSNNPKKITDEKNMQILGEYLKSKGVNKDDNKINILIDFCDSGATINALLGAIKEMLNLTDKQIIQIDIGKLIKELSKTTLANKEAISISKKERLNIIEDMAFQHFEHVSCVPHFYIDDEQNNYLYNCVKSSNKKSYNEVFKAFEEYSTPLGRCYELCIQNEIHNLKSNL